MKKLWSTLFVFVVLLLTVKAAMADLSVTEINFDNVNRENGLTTSFKVKNEGTVNVTNLDFQIKGVNDKYNMSFDGTLPTTLNVSQEVTITLKTDVPVAEDSGKHKLGDLEIRGTVATSTTTKVAPIYVNPVSFLSIESIEIDGKSSGDLSIEKMNEIDVNVKNNGLIEVEKIVVEVRILDIDGDDLDEEADDFDLRAGKDDDANLEFDLRNEKVDKDNFDIEVTVTGEDVNNAEHKIVTIKNVNLDIDRHNLVIRRSSVDSTILECVRQTNLRVNVENIGEEDEDEVVVSVRNDALNIHLTKSGIELDNLFRNDNEDTIRFNLDLEDARAGSYPLTIEVFRDEDRLEDSAEAVIQVKTCTRSSSSATTSSSGGSTVSTEERTAQLLAELQKKLDEQKNSAAATATTTDKTPVTTLKSNFRESNLYNFLLAVLGALTLVALVLAVVVLATKRK